MFVYLWVEALLSEPLNPVPKGKDITMTNKQTIPSSEFRQLGHSPKHTPSAILPHIFSVPHFQVMPRWFPAFDLSRRLGTTHPNTRARRALGMSPTSIPINDTTSHFSSHNFLHLQISSNLNNDDTACLFSSTSKL
jgi:hypothetical protein